MCFLCPYAAIFFARRFLQRFLQGDFVCCYLIDDFRVAFVSVLFLSLFRACSCVFVRARRQTARVRKKSPEKNCQKRFLKIFEKSLKKRLTYFFRFGSIYRLTRCGRHNRRHSPCIERIPLADNRIPFRPSVVGVVEGFSCGLFSYPDCRQ